MDSERTSHIVHSLFIVLHAEQAGEIGSGESVRSFFRLPWKSNAPEAAHDPRRGIPQQERVHLLALAYQDQGDMIEMAAEIGNEPFYPVGPTGEMVCVGQDHEFHLSPAELLG